MPIWFGNALGSAIGLMAILLGALYNARLTRKRDFENMDKEASAIASAIGAEMAVYTEILCSLFLQVMPEPDPGRSAAMLRALRAPDLTVWPALAGKVGLLGADLAGQTVRAWASLSMHCQTLQACIEDIQADEWDSDRIRNRANVLKMDLPMIADAVSALTGTRPEFGGVNLL